MRQAPIDYMARTRRQYDDLGYPPYAWVHNETAPPFTPLRRQLSASRIALIASGGVYKLGQVAFHFQDDCSYREIDADTGIGDLRVTHFAYDLTDARKDPNVVFPLKTLRYLVETGLIKGLGSNAYSFMGGIYSARKVRELLAPALAERVLADQVDLVLLVPV